MLVFRMSPRYLPDFVLHGTSEAATPTQDKLSKDLAHIVKVSVSWRASLRRAAVSESALIRGAS